MWNYDKLFTAENVVGLRNVSEDVIYNHGVFDREYWQEDGYVNWDSFMNERLEISNFKIQYIIRLDKHGNVIEKLFDREVDMKEQFPELKTGLFVELSNAFTGVVIDDRIVFSNGSHCFLTDYDLETGKSKYFSDYNIVKVWGKGALNFDTLKYLKPIWKVG